MLKVSWHSRYEKALKKIKKQGKDTEKLKSMIRLLSENKPLAPRYKNHKLKGDYSDHWECHIEPDWLLVYQKNSTEIFLVTMGTHSELF